MHTKEPNVKFRTDMMDSIITCSNCWEKLRAQNLYAVIIHFIFCQSFYSWKRAQFL